MKRGLDVSAAQGTIDWTAVAALGCEFAIVKACEGNKPGTDPQYQANVAGARAAGLAVGGYFFAYPLANIDPAACAREHFEASGGIGSHEGELPPALDLEWPSPDAWARWGCSAPQIRAWALAYLDAMATAWGRTPILYTYPSFWSAVGGANEPRFARYVPWIAAYPAPCTWPAAGGAAPIPRPWAQGTSGLWQFTGGAMQMPGGVPGDFDVWAGTDAEFSALLAPPSGRVVVTRVDTDLHDDAPPDADA